LIIFVRQQFIGSILFGIQYQLIADIAYRLRRNLLRQLYYRLVFLYFVLIKDFIDMAVGIVGIATERADILGLFRLNNRQRLF
jgi:hypothetical protein